MKTGQITNNNIPATADGELHSIMIDRFVLLDALSDPVTIIDRQYNYRYCNSAYLSLINKKSNDVIDHHMESVIGSDRFRVLLPHLDKAFTSETTRHTVSFVDDSGQKRYLEVDHRRFTTGDNDEWLVFSVSHDRTEIKLTQQNLQLFNQLIASR